MHFDFRKDKLTPGKVLSLLCIAVVVAVYAILVFRTVVRFDADIYSEVISDAGMKKAFDSSSPYVYKYAYPATEQRVGIGKVLSISNVYASPEAKQLQLCLKYNSGAAQAPTDYRIPYDFCLSDSRGNKYTSYYFRTDQRYGSNYIRVSFTDVPHNLDESITYTFEVFSTSDDTDIPAPIATFEIPLEKDMYRKLGFDF